MITIHTTPDCAGCVNVKAFYDRHEIEYETVDLLDNPEIAQNVFALTGTMTAPITTNGTEYVIGVDYKKLRELNA